MSDVQEWLDAERAHQRDKVAGAIADALLTQQQLPIVVPGPILYKMADRMIDTGVRHGNDWASDDAAVVPQWVRNGVAELDQEPSPVVEPQLPERGDFARAVTWADLNVT